MVTNKIQSLDLVVPLFNEEDGVADLVKALLALKKQLAKSKITLGVIFVDDHSSDKTPALLRNVCAQQKGFSFLRLSRRAGSHTAVVAGMQYCTSDCAAFVAADLQDPPSLLAEMIEECRRGHDVVWAARAKNDATGLIESAFSSLFHNLFQRLTGFGDLPSLASFALLSRRAYTNLVRNCRQRPSLIVEIPRLGYSVATVYFRRPVRKHGRSKWGLTRKLLAFADAIVSSSHKPLRAMTYTGLAVSVLGFAYAALLIVLWFGNNMEVHGWTSLMVVVLVIGGLQMLMLGVIGEYLWRAEEGTRRRALYLVEDSAGLSKAALAEADARVMS